MSGLRLAVVSRRFWPLADEPEMGLADLVEAMRQRGARPTLVTAQWLPHWPATTVFRETPLVRLPHPSPGGWGTYRYLRQLARWLRAQRSDFDAILVSRARLDAFAVLGAARTMSAGASRAVPVVLRAEGIGETGDAAWLAHSHIGRRARRRISAAHAIVASSEASKNELRGAGIADARLHVIAPGIDPVAFEPDVPIESQIESPVGTSRVRDSVPTASPPASAGGSPSKSSARRSLGEACRDLTTNAEDPVFLYIGRLVRTNNLSTLLVAWSRVAVRSPRACLWIIGDGPERERLYRRIVELGLRQQTFMPGSFDDLGGLLSAADVLLAPSRIGEGTATLLRGLAAGLPVLASDVAPYRELLGDAGGVAAKLLPARDAASWAQEMLRLANDAEARRRMAAETRRMAGQYTIARAADDHLALFDHLLRSPA